MQEFGKTKIYFPTQSDSGDLSAEVRSVHSRQFASCNLTSAAGVTACEFTTPTMLAVTAQEMEEKKALQAQLTQQMTEGADTVRARKSGVRQFMRDTTCACKIKTTTRRPCMHFFLEELLLCHDCRATGAPEWYVARGGGDAHEGAAVRGAIS